MADPTLGEHQHGKEAMHDKKKRNRSKAREQYYARTRHGSIPEASYFTAQPGLYSKYILGADHQLQQQQQQHHGGYVNRQLSDQRLGQLPQGKESSKRRDSRSRVTQGGRQARDVALDDPDSELGIAISKSMEGASLASALRSVRSAAELGSPSSPRSRLEGRLSSAMASLAQKTRPAMFGPAKKKQERRSSDGFILEWSDNWDRVDSDSLAAREPHRSASEDDEAALAEQYTVPRAAALSLCRVTQHYPPAASNSSGQVAHPSWLSADPRTSQLVTSSLELTPAELRRPETEWLNWRGPLTSDGLGLLPRTPLPRSHPRNKDRAKFESHKTRRHAKDSCSECELTEAQSPVDQMEENATCELLRIEKLFPNDDLDLAASLHPSSSTPQIQLKAARRWQAAVASSNFLRTLRRGGQGGATSGNPSTTSSSATSTEKTATEPSGYVTRKFLLESYAQLTVGLQTQERYLFLFNDVLFIAKPRPSAAGYKLKRRVPVVDMWITDVIGDVSEASHCEPTRSFVIGWPVTNLVVTFNTAETMQQWKSQLLTQMNDEKSKEPPEVFVDVHHKDASTNTNKTTSVNLHRGATSAECMSKAAEAFGISARVVADYQLWVTSSKENAPYPLYGHEEVSAILMSHQRESERTHDTNIKCQFILKERKKPDRLVDRKPLKMKKLDLSSLFRKNPNRPPWQASTDKNVGKTRLFGNPLSQVYQAGTPAPLEELLENLFNVAPFTCEIFRKPSNARECQEVVTKMNSEDQVNWLNYKKNGLLMASVLKSFLREMPNRLLHYELYSDWSQSTNIVDKDARISKNQSLLSQLDEYEREVLKRIFCILYYVQQRALHNRMTSYNLAVCLGPSLLWPPVTSKHDLSEASKLVPDVVQFMIDNSTAIFGQEELLLAFGHLPFPPPDEEASEREEAVEEDEAMRSLRTQYSESLESISDNDTPCGLEQMSPSSRSRDSGLILNDAPEEGDQSDENLARCRSETPQRVSSMVAIPAASARFLDKSRSYGSLTSNEAAEPIETKPRAGSAVESRSAALKQKRPTALNVHGRRTNRHKRYDEPASACGNTSTATDTPSPSGAIPCFHCHSPAVLTKSSSGGHLCFDAAAACDDGMVCRAAGAAGLKHKLMVLAEQSSKYAESAPSLLLHRELNLSASNPISSASESASSSPCATDDDEVHEEPKQSDAASADEPSSSACCSPDSDGRRQGAQIRRRSSEQHRLQGKCGSHANAVKLRRALPERSVSVTEHSFSSQWSRAALLPSQQLEQPDCPGGRIDFVCNDAEDSSKEVSVDEPELHANAKLGQNSAPNSVGLALSSNLSAAVQLALLSNSPADIGQASESGPSSSRDASPQPSKHSEQIDNRPKQPPSYIEAIQRQELTLAGVTEIERIKQTVMSTRAKQLYDRSVRIFEREQQLKSPRGLLQHEPNDGASNSSRVNRRSADCCFDEAGEAQNCRPGDQGRTASSNESCKDRSQGRTTVSVGTSPAVMRKLSDSTVVTTKDKTIIIRRSPAFRGSSASMFYQPGRDAKTVSQEVPFSRRPSNPPSYTELVQQKTDSEKNIEHPECGSPESRV